METGGGSIVERAGPMLRVWHLSLLVLFVAVAIVNIQDQRRGDRDLVLVGVAGAGFVAYGLLGVVGWRLARRFGGRLAPSLLVGAYLAAMAALFLVATVVYLLFEHVYHVGRLW